MSDMHVLTGSGESWNVIGHFAVPDQTNVASINYRTAIVNSGVGGTTVLPDGDGNGGSISAAEKSQIEAGELYEHAFSVRLEANGATTPAAVALLKERYAEMKTRVVNKVKARLKYFGHNESET